MIKIIGSFDLFCFSKGFFCKREMFFVDTCLYRQERIEMFKRMINILSCPLTLSKRFNKRQCLLIIEALLIQSISFEFLLFLPIGRLEDTGPCLIRGIKQIQ